MARRSLARAVARRQDARLARAIRDKHAWGRDAIEVSDRGVGALLDPTKSSSRRPRRGASNSRRKPPRKWSVLGVGPGFS
eukprot:5267075-Pyramimonas_sp.AAC.1